MSAEPILKVENLSVAFDGETVLHDVSFSVNKGEVLAILGPNGAGKSVLFRALLGVVPYAGTISWLTNSKIGYVPQKLAIERNLPLTVKEFFYLKTSITQTALHEVLTTVGLSHTLLDQPLGTLSGGQFQRVLIAWALLGQPEVLLFDEPTAGVDIGGEETIYHLLHQLQTKHHLTIIIISHDLNVVYQYANQVICINKKMICSGTPKEVLDSTNLSKLYGAHTALYEHGHNHPH